MNATKVSYGSAAILLLGASGLSWAATPCPPGTLQVDSGTAVQTSCPQANGTLSQTYPGDVGMASDSDVIWYENFEEGSVNNVTARYNDVQNSAGMALIADKPVKSRGTNSLRMTSSGSGTNATHLFKNLTNSSGGNDEVYVRYYVKYPASIEWHHSGVWMGGYNPAQNWPNPQAGLKPNGDDRFSIGFEPVTNATGNTQLDFYNYWMTMHSWMATPTGNTAYYGNTILHNTAAVAADNQWACVEIHLKLNPDGASRIGSRLDIWMNDTVVQQYADASPQGYWVADNFCPENTTDQSCTQYRTSSTPLAPLDQRYRSTTALKMNYLWLQNYITTSGVTASMSMDDIVVAKRRVGCIQ